MRRPATDGCSGGAGGGSLTFSDGLTRASDTVRNDLVTGVEVAHLNVQTPTAAQFRITDAGAVTLQSAAGEDFTFTSGLGFVLSTVGAIAVTAGASIGIQTLLADPLALTSGAALTLDATALLDLAGSGIRILSKVGSQLVLGSGANTLIDAGGNILATAGGNFSFTADAASNGGFIVTTDGTGDVTVNASRDEIHTVGRNFTVSAAGSGGASIGTTIGNLTLDAGTIDETAEVRIMPRGAAPAGTLTFRIWDGAGAGQATILPPSGGGTVDAQSRTTIGEILTALFGWGFISNPTP